jgi:hypothetical protein
MLMLDQTYLLVTFWQRQHGLLVDGIIGPKTLASFANAKGRGTVDVEPTDGAMKRIILTAVIDIGEGEEGGNNAGPYVRSLREYCGFPVDMLGPWCSIFASAKTKQALTGSGLGIPLSRGAYRLVMNIGESPYGEFITVPEPGFACWKRRWWERKREAHVRIITGYDKETDTMHYVAGNEKGKVVVGQLKNGKWRKDLIKMSTIRKAI